MPGFDRDAIGIYDEVHGEGGGAPAFDEVVLPLLANRARNTGDDARIAQ